MVAAVVLRSRVAICLDATRVVATTAKERGAPATHPRQSCRTGKTPTSVGAIPKNLRSSKVKVCVRCKAVCWMVPLLAVVPVEPAVHDDAAVSAALVSQGAGDEFTSDDDASGESE